MREPLKDKTRIVTHYLSETNWDEWEKTKD